MRCNETCFILSEEAVWDEEDRDGPQNTGLFTIQPPDMTASLRIFYCRWVRPSPLVLQHQMGKNVSVFADRQVRDASIMLTGKEHLNCS